ncbi:MAG: hypothetical protein A7316_08995 [Candidatus Altiarchaeales archaeon WOR_SM1_86-2]|nr:MAG: hypothetical protein A7316_08995 [Candidatus Altiarchaeales archaeon WOR_SM1_86-2]
MMEEKTKERALLLMRFYWEDEIYRIGRELNILYFNKFEKYWDIDKYQGALEISKIITDDSLFQIIKANPPKYRLSLGGFQGKYYTATEKGKVEIADSWDNVKKNVQEVLDKWGEKAYGLLQAIINKGGTASYFDLIHEIGKVIGYAYIPSILLPSLRPFKLIFKTGSNKYPDWTMPQEIIPIVQQEIKSYKEAVKEKPARKVKPEKITPSEAKINMDLLLLERKLFETVENIANKMREINFIFRGKFDTVWFKDNNLAILDISKPCSREEEFTNRILSLSTFISEVETKKIKEFLGGSKLSGSINLLETFLDKVSLSYDKKCIGDLRKIQYLRNKKYPVHADDKKFMEALNHFGFSSFPPDWEELWETILQRYLKSLEKIKESLESCNLKQIKKC